MLLQANMVKRITASGGGDLEALSNESLLVKRIECVPSSNDSYLTISIDRVTVAYYRVKGKSGNHLSTIRTGYLQNNLMAFLTEQGINVSLPIAEGQILTVKRYAETGNVILVYDRYSAGDIKADMPNGSASKAYTFIQYAKVGTAPTASGDALIDKSLTPAEFMDFPCGKLVPPLHTVELLGIVGSPFVDGAAGPISFATAFLKLIKDREVLFDPDRNGIPFDGQDAAATALAYKTNFSLIGSCVEGLLTSNVTPLAPPLMFNPPIKFDAGQELNAFLNVVKTGDATWTDNVDDQAFILRVRRQ